MANHHTRENPAPTAEENAQLERWSRRPRPWQNTRGTGLMAGFDVIPKLFGSEIHEVNLLMDIAECNRLFIRAVGNTIVPSPPYIISTDEFNELIKCLKLSIDGM